MSSFNGVKSSFGSWHRWAWRWSAAGSKKTIPEATWSVSLSGLPPPSGFHLTSLWDMQAGKTWTLCLLWGVGWGVSHQRGPFGGHWCWLLFSTSLSKYSEHACILHDSVLRTPGGWWRIKEQCEALPHLPTSPVFTTALEQPARLLFIWIVWNTRTLPRGFFHPISLLGLNT